MEAKFLWVREAAQAYNGDDEALVQRRAALESAFVALPPYGSASFWQCIEEPEEQCAIPLETIVKLIRVAAEHGDEQGRNRLLEIVVRRTQAANELWAQQALAGLLVSGDERQALAGDLYADLCENLLRALMDPQRLFWEEHFYHCLRFERKHVYHAFMRREGRWQNPQAKKGERRVPRQQMQSLERAVYQSADLPSDIQIEDEQATRDLQAVERDDLARLVLYLPEKLRAVVWLIFWEERTEKSVAQLLGVSDRTVRNRLHEALRQLRGVLEESEEVS